MRILISGAGGQLGHELRRSLSDVQLFAFDHQGLDVTDLKQTVSTVGHVAPDLVIHAAAYTDVDGCEIDPDRAFLVNALGTRHLAIACLQHGAALAYISTDYVFDGTKGSPYLEYDEPNPISAYGRSKLAGERCVQILLSRHYIVRTSWLYSNTGRNFVKTILSRSRLGKLLGVVDEVGSPTYAKDLADALSKLVRHNAYGVYHLANEGHCSRYEYIRTIVGIAGVNAEVAPVTADEFLAEHPLPARRPRYSALRNFCAANSLGIKLRPWQEALAEMLQAEMGETSNG